MAAPLVPESAVVVEARSNHTHFLFLHVKGDEKGKEIDIGLDAGPYVLCMKEGDGPTVRLSLDWKRAPVRKGDETRQSPKNVYVLTASPFYSSLAIQIATETLVAELGKQKGLHASCTMLGYMPHPRNAFHASLVHSDTRNPAAVTIIETGACKECGHLKVAFADETQ